MEKLDNINYSQIGRMGINILLARIDNLEVDEGLRIVNFPDYQKMRELTMKIETHLSEREIFRRVADENNLTYIVRRVA